MLPVTLTVAGSDNSAGAGAQADLKTFSALGCYGLTAITCIVAEIPGKVTAIQPVEPGIVAEQVRLCFEAFPVAAVKTGMLYSRDIIATVCDTLDARDVPALIVDPVMVATSGDPLLLEDAIALYEQRLFPRATLVTPNLDEVRVLLARISGGDAPPLQTVADMRAAGLALAARHRCDWLIKGGHLRGDTATDLLITRDGTVTEHHAPYVPGVNTHGTGCTTSAAITAALARGLALHDAVTEAKKFVHNAIAAHLRWEKNGQTTDALHHFAS
jgi:hydroxymethylpyrimidine/phosphomethylpyrimidine kinase